MKKMFVFMLALLMLSLCACGKPPEPESVISDLDAPPPVEESVYLEEEETDPAPVTKEETTPAETEAPPAETEAPSSLIDTEYYTLTLPSDWIGKCICDIHERDNGTYSLSVHETNAFFSFGGGTLFTIMMLPTTEDYTIFPSYELLGSMDTPEGTFYLVALFPTDVQFTEENVAVYNEMYEGVADVLDTLAPKNGIILEKPET